MKKKYTTRILWIILYFFVVLPFLITILFSVPCSDDFSMSNQFLKASTGNVLADSFNLANYQYTHWGGGWPFNFLQYIFNPLSFHSASSYYYGLFLTVSFIVFVFLFIVFLNVLLKYVFKLDNINSRNVFCITILFTFLNTGIYFEIFYWFVGNSYLWEIDALLLTLTLTILYFRVHTTIIMFVLLCICSAISSFFYQMAPIVFVYIVFEMYIYKRNNNKLKKYQFIPLLFVVVFAACSCFAPGNFARQLAENENMALGPGDSHVQEVAMNSGIIKKGAKAFFYSVQNMYKIYFNLITLPIFIFCIFVCFGGGCYVGKIYKHGFKNIVLLIVFQLFAVFCIVFPVAYGYGRIDFPNRMVFIVNLVIVVFSGTTSLFVGSLCSKKLSFFAEKKNIAYVLLVGSVAFSVILFVPSTKNKTYFEELPYVYTASNMYHAYEQSADTKRFLNSIAESDETDIVVTDQKYADSVDSCGFIRVPVLFEDSNNWVNKAMAEYYGKNSIRLQK